MKKAVTKLAFLFILSSLLIPVLSFAPIQQVNAAEQIFFEDDFESYNVGAFPSNGGWEMIFNGAGSQYQVIVDSVSASPAKSLQLLGQSNWACDTVKRFDSDSPIIGYEVQVLVEDIGVVDLPMGRAGFWSRPAPNIGRFYALVDFYGGGTIRAGGETLQNYTANTWYKVRVILNKETSLFNVWINDRLLLEDGVVKNYDPHKIEAFGLASEMFGSVKAYFDDVKVFSVFDVNPKLELVPETGIAATTLVGSGFAPNSKISVTWDSTSIPTVPSPLSTDGYGNFTAMISVLNQTDGTYIVKAVDEIGTEANATFTVTLDAQTTTHNVAPEKTDLGISILSPENRTYNTPDIPVAYTKNETCYYVGYSLDGQMYTDQENTTLTGLQEGAHQLMFYANYSDSFIGESATVWFTVDTTPPTITDVIHVPVNFNGTLDEGVRVNATATDNVSGVERVTLSYTDDNSTWVNVEMAKLEGNVWTGTIPAFPHGTIVTYTIMAEDKAGNTVTTEEQNGQPNQYEVLPEFPLWIIVPLFLIATVSAAIVAKKRLSIPAFAKIYHSIHKLLT